MLVAMKTEGDLRKGSIMIVPKIIGLAHAKQKVCVSEA